MPSETILGDAVIKVRLDTKAAEKTIDAVGRVVSARGRALNGLVNAHGSGYWQERKEYYDKGREDHIQSTSNSPLASGFKAVKSIMMGHPTAAGQELAALMGQGARFALWAVLIKKVVDGLEASPLFVNSLQKLAPAVFDNAVVDGIKDRLTFLSNTVSDVKARLAAIGETNDQLKELTRAQLQLGNSVGLSEEHGAYQFLYQLNSYAEKINRKVEKLNTIPALVLNESFRGSVGR